MNSNLLTPRRWNVLLLSLLFPMMAAAQVPSVQGWLSGATEIKPGLWIANAEVSVRDYEAFEWYLRLDSGEAIRDALLPPPEFYPLDHSTTWGYWQEGNWEPDHPMAGITRLQADAYCKWFSIHLMRIQLGYDLGVDYRQRPENFPEIRFRLPTPEEWNLATAKILPPQKTTDYQELPSRFVHTRTVQSSRKGEKLLHFHDNVSEMTTDVNIVMGGNFASEGLGISTLSGEKPDQKMGFRIVLEFPDRLEAFYPKIPNATLHKWELYTPWDKPRDRPIQLDPKHRQYENEFYPYNLKQQCIEIEPNIWVSKTDVSVGQFAYYMYFLVSDSGESCIPPGSPMKWTYSSDARRLILLYNLNETTPQQRLLPMRGASQREAEEFCQWMTGHHYFEVSPPGNACRYRFRLMTPAELELAIKVDPTVTAKATEMGFRFVVEVMPTHPDAVRFKAVPAHLVKGYYGPWNKNHTIWPGFD